MKVRLNDIVRWHRDVGPGGVAYLDLETGEILGFLSEYFAMAEEGAFQEGDDVDFHPQWGREMVLTLPSAEQPDRFLPLPERYEFDEYKVMQRFVRTDTTAPDGAACLRYSRPGRIPALSAEN
jgi:hypothetical protein